MLLSFAVAAVAVRELGASRYGTWAAISAVLALVNVLDFGAGWHLARAVAQDRNRAAARQRLLVVVLALGMLGAILCLVAFVGSDLVGSVLRLDSGDRGAFRRALVGAVAASAALGIGNASLTLLYGLGRGAVAASTIGVGALVQSGSSIALLRAGLGIDALVLGIVLDAIVVCLAAAYLLRRFLGSLVAAPTRAHVGELWSFGKWVQVTASTEAVAGIVDRLALGSISGPSALVPLDISSRLGVAVRTVPSSILAGGFGAIAERVQDPEAAAAKRIHSWMYRLLLLLTVLTASVVIAIAEPTYLVLTGQRHARSEVLFAAVAGAVTLGVAGGPAASILRASGRASWEARYACASLFARIALIGVLVRPWGLTGVLVAWLSGASIGLVVLFRQIRGLQISAWPGIRTVGFAVSAVVTALLLGAGTTFPSEVLGPQQIVPPTLFVAGSQLFALIVLGAVWKPLSPGDIDRLAGAVPGRIGLRLRNVLRIVAA